MRPDWASRMFGVITEHMHTPFVWGQSDCCMFVAKCLDAMKDTGYVSWIGAQYSDEASALRFIARHGGLKEAVTSILGDSVEGRPLRGNAVLFDGGDGLALGICDGSDIVAMGPEGIKRVPKSAALAVWR